MKEVVLKIPEKKYEFFMELIEHLGFQVAVETDIPEAHKTIVRERIKNSKPEELVAWDDARGQFRFKGK